MTDDILGEVKDYLVLTVGDARRHVTAGGIDKLPDIDVDVAVALHRHPRRGAMSIGAPVSAESLLAWLVRVSPIRAKQVGDMARWLNHGAPHQQRHLSRFAWYKWTRMKQMICLKAQRVERKAPTGGATAETATAASGPVCVVRDAGCARMLGSGFWSFASPAPHDLTT